MKADRTTKVILAIVAVFILFIGCVDGGGGGSDGGGDSNNDDLGTAPRIWIVWTYNYPNPGEMTFFFNPGDQYICEIKVDDPDLDVVQIEQSIYSADSQYSGPEIFDLPPQEHELQYYLSDPMTTGPIGTYTLYFKITDSKGNVSNESTTTIYVVDWDLSE